MKCPKCGRDGTAYFNTMRVGKAVYWCEICKDCEQKILLMARQKNKCSICGTCYTRSNSFKISKDHLICNSCADGLQHFGQNCEILRNAVNHLIGKDCVPPKMELRKIL